ncbi:MAG: hypothetical protein CL946_01635 [Ectothiorhodospiraceae bacterium]|nr:hypothetical protein [Ectothiorhodospiraceae bacterium]
MRMNVMLAAGLAAVICSSLSAVSPLHAQQSGEMTFGEKPSGFDGTQIPTDDPPKLARQLDVAYPDSAVTKRLQGIAVVAVYIDKHGNPSYGELQKSSGHETLDRAALEAVKNGYYVPAKRDGVPAGSRVTVPVEFKLPTDANEWDAPKNRDELREDIDFLDKTKQQIDEERRALEEEIRRLKEKMRKKEAEKEPAK